MKNASFNPIFRDRFHICTSIKYLPKVIVEPRWRTSYEKAWKHFLEKKRPRKPFGRFLRFETLLNRIEELGDDLPYCQRVRISFINEEVGYGVFANQFIPPYSILNQYAGILKPDKTIAADNDSTFMFLDFPAYSIDAKKAGNWTRFVNHGQEKGKHTNVLAWEHYSRKWGPRIILTASWRGIKKDEQLLYSYGSTYWDEDRYLHL